MGTHGQASYRQGSRPSEPPVHVDASSGVISGERNEDRSRAIVDDGTSHSLEGFNQLGRVVNVIEDAVGINLRDTLERTFGLGALTQIELSQAQMKIELRRELWTAKEVAPSFKQGNHSFEHGDRFLGVRSLIKLFPAIHGFPHGCQKDPLRDDLTHLGKATGKSLSVQGV
jgi:hypothetical protein